MGCTPAASAALRRTRTESSCYVMELGLLNKGELDLTSWQAAITLPDGADMAARDGAAVEHGPASHVYTVRPRPITPIAPGDRQTIAVEVSGTAHAPAAARFIAMAADGTVVKAAVTLMAVVVAGESREADESTWPGSTAIEPGAAGIGMEIVDTGRGGGGGLGGGGGGGATTRFRISIEWENDSGGGGGAGGGAQSGTAACGQPGVDWQQYRKSADQGAAGSDGRAGVDWQRYQEDPYQGALGTSTQPGADRRQDQKNPFDELNAAVDALSERVANLEGGKP